MLGGKNTTVDSLCIHQPCRGKNTMIKWPGLRWLSPLKIRTQHCLHWIWGIHVVLHVKHIFVFIVRLSGPYKWVGICTIVTYISWYWTKTYWSFQSNLPTISLSHPSNPSLTVSLCLSLSLSLSLSVSLSPCSLSSLSLSLLLPFSLLSHRI